MKKIISKILIIFIIMIMLFEFICPSNVSYAALDISDEFINSLTSLMGGIVAYGIWLDRVIALGISTVFNGILSTSYAASCGVNWGLSAGIATPYSIFFNKYVLFDVNFFNLDLTTENSTMIQLRNGVAEWFYLMRTIAAAVLLCVLIYIGIRMALSTVAEEKAKYKKMFFDWCCSLALIFVLQYIAVFTIYVNNAIVDALREAHKGSDMDTAILQIATQAIMPVGLGSIVATFVYCMIVFQTIAFMVTYTQRMLKTGFLIIISPLISITYSIDKIGDGKAQALNSWLKEFVYTVLIQPFHCLIYMAFVSTAIALFDKSTILGSLISLFTGEFNQLTNGVIIIFCMKFINDGEKAVRKIFNFQDDGNLTSLAAGTVVTIAAVKNAQKIGEMGAKGASNLSGMYKKLSKSGGEDISKALSMAFGKNMASGDIAKNIGNKFTGSKAGQGLSNFSKNTKVGRGATQAGKWVGKKGKGLLDQARQANEKAQGAFQKYQEWSNKKHKQWDADAKNPNKNRAIRGFQSWYRRQMPTTHNLRRALPGALGLMGAAMSYATGDSGAMEALGVGSALSKGSESLFANSMRTLAKDKRESGETWEESKIDLEKNTRDRAIIEAANTAMGEGQTKYTFQNLQKHMAEYMKAKKVLENPDATQEQKDKANAHIEKLRKDGVLDAFEKRSKLSTQEGIEEFKQELRAGLLTGGASYGSDAIKTKLTDIKNLLKDYIEQKNKASQGDKDSDTENTKDVDSDFTTDQTFQLLRDSINRSVVFGSGGTFDANEMLQNELKINDDGSDTYQDLVRATLEYREMLANDRSEAVFDKGEKLQVGREALQDRAYKSSTSA